MTQTLQKPSKRQPPAKQPSWIVPNVSWEQLEAIDHAFEPTPGLKFFYLDGTLEIVPIGDDHERYTYIIRRLLEAYLDFAGIRHYGRGGPTYGKREQGARSEPDESYNIGERKEYPDLVIEVVDTSGGIDKLAIYKRLKVQEVWYWEDGVLDIHSLTQDGYIKLKESRLLPNLPFDIFCRYIDYYDQYEAVIEFKNILQTESE